MLFANPPFFIQTRLNLSLSLPVAIINSEVQAVSRFSIFDTANLSNAPRTKLKENIMEWLERLTKLPFNAGSFLIAAIVLFVFQWWRQRKSFKYRVISEEAVVDINQDYNDQVKILFDDRQVKRVHLIVMELKNHGWHPIEDKDFSEPLTISFGQSANLMTHTVLDCKPENLKVKTDIKTELTPDIEANQVVIQPLLLNRGDTIKLKALIDNYESPVKVEARIKGIPTIKKAETDLRGVGQFALALLVMLALSFFIRSIEWDGIHMIVTASVAAADTSEPLSNAKVTLKDSNGGAYIKHTDSSGMVAFRIPVTKKITSLYLLAEQPGFEAAETGRAPNPMMLLDSLGDMEGFDLQLKRSP
ncbi:MAG: hypothetical protein HYR56_19045 [Acidobacteria bacterium]|nr:hypothetical protein [Acidobacteriota bacterium]